LIFGFKVFKKVKEDLQNNLQWVFKHAEFHTECKISKKTTKKCHPKKLDTRKQAKKSLIFPHILFITFFCSAFFSWHLNSVLKSLNFLNTHFYIF